MKKIIRKFRQWFMNAMPGTYVRLSKLVCRHVLFQRERRYLGGQLKSRSDQPSVIFFGGHRAASMFLGKVFSQLAEDANLHRIDLESYFLHTDRSKVDQLFTAGECEPLFREEGFFYGPLRRPVLLENLNNYRVVLLLRDLRDVLTSGYYSIVYAHTVIDDLHRKARERAAAQGVDEYVRENLPAWKARYLEVLDWADTSGIRVERYEDMVEDFGGWLRRVTPPLGLDGNQRLIEEIISQADFDVVKEDKTAHKRSVKAGSHARKLQPETAAFLNQELAEVLQRMGYEEGS